MILTAGTWRKWLANGLLALALMLSHAAPVMSFDQMTAPAHHAQAQEGHCQDILPDQMPASMVPQAACQACPGMAIFLPEPMRLPIRATVFGFALPEPQERQGISISLDTPPPKSLTVV